MRTYTSSQKLWRIVKDKYEYYYEIKLDGMIIDRIKIEYPAKGILENEGLIKGKGNTIK